MLVSIIAGGLAGLAVWLLLAEPSGRLRTLLGRASEPASPGARLGRSRPSSAGAAAPGPARRGHRARGARASDIDLLAFDLDLAAICLQAGLPTERALELAAQAGGDRSGLGRLGRALELGGEDPADSAERGRDGPSATAEALESVAALIGFSRATGVSLAPLLRGLASDLRRTEHRRRQLAAARLGVQLVIPLGVCILPAFILLGVVPVLLTLVSDMAGLFR